MLPALTFDDLQEKVRSRYEHDEKRVIGIIMARYDISLVKNVVAESYQYWNKNTWRDFDIYWAGYGQYLYHGIKNSSCVILQYRGNDCNTYYDEDAFINMKRSLNHHKGVNYRDKFELFLFNYYDGRIHFDEFFCIDLEKNLDENYASIREMIEYLTEACRKEYDVVSLAKTLKGKQLWDTIKGVKASDIINTAIGAAGLFL